MKADIVAEKPDGDPVVAVEVKNLPALDPSSAQRIRRDLLANNGASRAPYFLLITQDVGYLWNGEGSLGQDVPPRVSFPMGIIVQRLLPDQGEGRRVVGHALELVVANWLLGLSGGLAEDLDLVPKELLDSGLIDALLGAKIRLQEQD